MAILHAVDLWCYWVRLANLNLKTQPKYLRLDIALPANVFDTGKHHHPFLMFASKAGAHMESSLLESTTFLVENKLERFPLEATLD